MATYAAGEYSAALRAGERAYALFAYRRRSRRRELTRVASSLVDAGPRTSLCLKVAFSENIHVMRHVAGRQKCQRADGEWIVAGDAATIPRGSRQGSEESQCR